jgi:hypothetical protein
LTPKIAKNLAFGALRVDAILVKNTELIVRRFAAKFKRLHQLESEEDTACPGSVKWLES